MIFRSNDIVVHCFSMHKRNEYFYTAALVMNIIGPVPGTLMLLG